MTAVDSSPKCACCAPSQAPTTDETAEPAGRARILAGAERVGIEGPDLDALMLLFEQGACIATREQPTMALAPSALDGMAGPGIVCTLDGGLDAMRGRIDEWQAVIGAAVGRRPVAGGVALQYEHDSTVAVELARLAAAEFACCSFFEFSLSIGARGMEFAVSAPDEAREVVLAVFGAAEPAAVGDR